jgi:hypothetical protein
MSQVRVSESTHEILRSLSSQEGKSMQDILDKAVEDYRRKAFLEGLSDDYRLLQESPEAWAEHEEEMALWNNVMTDGINNE